MSNEKDDQLLQDYIQRLELAEQMLPIIGRLYRNNGMLMRIYGRAITHVTTVDILTTHRFARQYTGEELSIQHSFQLVQAMEGLQLAPAKIDLGRLTNQWRAAGEGVSATDFLRKELAPVVGQPDAQLKEPRDIVLYGFGRIGRLLAR